MNATPNKKSIVLTSLLLFLVVFLCEGMSRLAQPFLSGLAVGLDFRPTREIYEGQKKIIARYFERRTNIIFDPDLGWRYRPSLRSGAYINESLDLRSTNGDPMTTRADTLRIAAFGDSFVYGSEVQYHQSWPFQLESMVAGIEVLNFGVAGYGTDQAYLMYEKFGKQYNPRVVFIGFTTVQLARNVNVYRRFFSPDEMMLVKPRFVLSPEGNLRVVPSPIRSEAEMWKYYTEPARVTELGRNDYWYARLVYENPLYDHSATVRVVSQALTFLRRKLSSRNNIVLNGRLNPKSEAFEITRRILNLFSQSVIRNGGIPIILLFPEGDRLGGDGRREIPVYEALVDEVRKDRLEYLDLAEAFREPVTREKHFMAGRHYSAYSNGLVARRIAAYLRERGLIELGSRKHAVKGSTTSLRFQQFGAER